MHNKTENINPHLLIAKKATMQISDQELHQLEEWMNNSVNNKLEYNEIHQLNHITKIDKTILDINVDDEWNKFKSNANIQPKTISFLNPLIKIAAVIAVVLGAYLTLSYYANATAEYQLVADGKIKQITMADGSKIAVNHNSTLSYNAQYNVNQRVVNLKGDAYFEVAPNKQKPFFVETKNVIVKVVGTSFYVRELADENKVEIVVNSGQVTVSGKNKQSETILNPGDVAIYNADADTLHVDSNINPNYLSWKTKRIVFERATLTQVVADLNRIYNAQIEISDDDIRNIQITTTFNNQPLEAVLKVIEATMSIHISRENNKIILSGRI